MADTETLADKARKIGEDVAGVWAILQSRGAMIPHRVNTENLQDVVPQLVAINQWDAKGLFLYNHDGNFYDFYTKHEVMEMTALPPAPEDSDGWPMTLAQVKAAMEGSPSYIIMVAEGAVTAETIINLNLTDSSKLEPQLQVYFSGITGLPIIHWGDGTTDVVQQEGWFKKKHLYSATGEYDIVIQLDDTATLSIGKVQSSGYDSVPGVLGSTFDGYKKFLVGATVGARTALYPYAFAPRTYTYGYNESNLSNLSTVSLPSNLTAIPEWTFLESKVGHFPLNNNINTVGKYAFAGSKIDTQFYVPDGIFLEDHAFYFAKMDVAVLDLSKVGKIGDYCFNKTRSNSATGIGSVILPDDETKVGVCAFFDAGVGKATIPDTWEKVPTGLFGADNANERTMRLEEITLPDSLKEIEPGAFGSYIGDGSDIVLPSSLEVFAGFNLANGGDKSLTQYPALTIDIPNSVYKLGNYAFSRRVLVNLTIPSSVTTLGDYVFNSAIIYDDEVVIPSTVTSFGSRLFSFAYVKKLAVNATLGGNQFTPIGFISTDEMTIGAGSTNFTREDTFVCLFGLPDNPDNVGNNNYKKMSLFKFEGDDITLGRGCFRDSFVSKIAFDGNLVSIDGRKTFYLFGDRFNATHHANTIYEIDLTNCTSVPTVDNPSGPSSSNPTFYVNATYNVAPKVIVPDALYNDWIAASGWSDWSQYIVKESEA